MSLIRKVKKGAKAVKKARSLYRKSQKVKAKAVDLEMRRESLKQSGSR